MEVVEIPEESLKCLLASTKSSYKISRGIPERQEEFPKKFLEEFLWGILNESVKENEFLEEILFGFPVGIPSVISAAVREVIPEEIST